MPHVDRRVFQLWLLLIAGTFAFVWAAVRAGVQSITMDEAQTYLFSIARPNLWYPYPNNHILNSLLMWGTTHAFGVSNIAVRLPTLLGAILYIATCIFLCRSITHRFSLQFPLFLCLTFNPLICDYMVAARGYGLANAFLLAAIAVPVWHTVNGRLSLRTSCALASVALGLSFAANFSFAFVDMATFLGLVIWALAWVRRHRESESMVQVVEFCVRPGLFVALLLCGYSLAHWKKGELWWGAHSFSEMTRSLIESSFYRLDPGLLGPGLYKAMSFLKPLLLPLLGILCLLRLVATRLDGSRLKDVWARWPGAFAAALAGIVSLSLLIHGLAFYFARLPLPMGRTGIYLVPLVTLLAGTIAAAPARSMVRSTAGSTLGTIARSIARYGASQWLGRGITAVLMCLACTFLLCLRVSHFREYEWDAE